jgi:hypothetical protein
MSINDEVVLVNDDEYQTPNSHKMMTVRRGQIGRVTGRRDARSVYVKFRDHQIRAFFEFEVIKILR